MATGYDIQQEGGNNFANIISIAKNNPLEYEYPNGFDLRPGSPLHDKIMNYVLVRARLSRDALSKRFSGWKEIDRTLTTYIDMSTYESNIKQGDKRKPVAVVVPETYATLDTLLTYLSAAFLGEPYFRYEGVGPEDVSGAILLELVVAQQCRRARVGLEMHTMWRDALAYGFSAAHIGWNQKFAYKTVSEEETILSRLTNELIGTGEFKESKERVKISEGSTLSALDPYLCLPDPYTPIEKMDDAEFFGWTKRRSLMAWMSLEGNDNNYFNMKYLKHTDGLSVFGELNTTGRYDKYGNSGVLDSTVAKPVDIIHMYVRIIPSEFGIGDGEYPELWLFGLAADGVVVRAQSLGLDHNKIPVTITAPDFDGHSLTPLSRLETISGMQGAIDWLFKSHFANVRKSVNNIFVVDPMLVNVEDVRHLGEENRNIIRLRRQAFGRGTKDVIEQLHVMDVTQGNMADTQYLTQIIRESTGAQDAISGIRRNTSERVSATEAQATVQGALSRLEKMAKVISLQSHYDIAEQMAWNTRQLMEDETFTKIVGNWKEVLTNEYGVTGDRVAVSPKQLDINFDVIPHDGTIPMSGNSNTWLQILQTVSSNPVLAQNLDIVKIFKHAARIAGAKDINYFDVNNTAVQTMGQEDINSNAEKGNIVPIDEIAAPVE